MCDGQPFVTNVEYDPCAVTCGTVVDGFESGEVDYENLVLTGETDAVFTYLQLFDIALDLHPSCLLSLLQIVYVQILSLIFFVHTIDDVVSFGEKSSIPYLFVEDFPLAIDSMIFLYVHQVQSVDCRQ